MNKEEIFKKFEKNVEYLRKNIPPDDIYLFAEETFMAAMYFIHRWREHVDLKEEMEKDEIAKKWLTNILTFHYCQNEEVDIQLNLNCNYWENI